MGTDALIQLSGRMAVVTGGGSGMGRQLCCLLASEGCHVAFADLSPAEMAETRALCEGSAAPGTRVTAHVCDVSSEEAVLAFRDELLAAHGGIDHVHFVFNNAGVGGGASFLDGAAEGRAQWERTFAVDWFGVCVCTAAASQPEPARRLCACGVEVVCASAPSCCPCGGRLSQVLLLARVRAAAAARPTRRGVRASKHVLCQRFLGQPWARLRSLRVLGGQVCGQGLTPMHVTAARHGSLPRFPACACALPRRAHDGVGRF
jgi:NAD(P)-dependent dehydrogenase (short-subunit alcohol dehydrogenase family)